MSNSCQMSRLRSLERFKIAIQRTLNVVDWLFSVLAVSALLAIIVVVLIQVFSRFLLPSSPIWTEELSRYLFIYLIVMGSGLVIRQNRHVRLELFQSSLNRFWYKAYQVFCHLLAGGFAVYIFPYAIKYAEIGRWQTSPALEVPMYWAFLSVSFFFMLTALYSVTSVLLILLERDDQGVIS
ncbi:TRAP transporter small permease [Marinomonas posidonica]|uniref:TRAP transporter small permease protein n=1 Tax=Marinomonas posidonica (strain CECT 7376 / NCIMB 14433 / IVIA-Po-181) TaxID=491952 RepID=F6CYX3_MARPP|nr:TRAP transporter small permease [Marinomonas posidonica]AEF53100.1 Tripartite ATP-independent periplasmic transporter DctQ component [Marinomonas posidonica IVIA-Po-181]